ncbi:MAG: 3D domain-containing protein [Bacteroidota bacterium]
MSKAMALAAAAVMTIAAAMPTASVPASGQESQGKHRIAAIPASQARAPVSVLFTVTAYCPCRACCGKTDGITASGRPAVAGRTVAVDPGLIPFGTRLVVPELGERVAEDTGGSIRGRRLDVFFRTHAQARSFGRRLLRVEILPARTGR